MYSLNMFFGDKVDAISSTYALEIFVSIAWVKIYSLNMFFGDNVDAISSTYAREILVSVV